MRKIDPTGQFRRDYKREAKGQHRAHSMPTWSRSWRLWQAISR